MISEKEKSGSSGSRAFAVFAISLPILVGLIIIFTVKTAEWLPEIGKPIRGGVTTVICDYIGAGIGHGVSFAVIAIIVRGLIKKGANKTEIYCRLFLLLIPVSIITAYWLRTYDDPLAQGFLWFVNFPLIFFGHLIGRFIFSPAKGS